MTASLLVALLLGAAQSTGTMSPTSDVSGNRVRATVGGQSRSLADRFSDVVNVLDFIPRSYHPGIQAGTDVHDLTDYIQLAISTANGGTVMFPSGTYNHTGLTVSKSTSLEGVGWGFDLGAAKLINTSLTNDSITIRGPTDGMPPGTRLFNLYIKGGRDVRPTATGNGIVVDVEGQILIDQVYVAWAGGSGLVLNGGLWNTTVTTIHHSRFESNGLDGIYGLGSSAHMINAITIETSEIRGNLRHGINVWPTTLLTIERNTIQGNLGWGIYMDASGDGLGTAAASGDVVNIHGNYLEQNHSGCFYVRSENSGGRIRSMWNISVSGNMFSVIGVDTPPATLAKFECDTSGGFVGTYWGHNSYNENTGMAYVDFGNCHEYTSVLDHAYFDPLGPFTTKFQNASGMTIRGLATASMTRYSGTPRTEGITLYAHQAPEIQHWDADLGADYVATLSTTSNSTTSGDKFRLIRNGWGPGTLNVGPGLHTFPRYVRGWVDVMFDGTQWRKIAEGPVQGVDATVAWDPGEIPTSGYVSTLVAVTGARPEMNCSANDLYGIPAGVFVTAHSDGTDRIQLAIHNRKPVSVPHTPSSFVIRCH